MLNLASILFQLKKMEEILVFPHEMVTPDDDTVVIAEVANIGWSITVNDEPLLVYHVFFLLCSFIVLFDYLYILFFFTIFIYLKNNLSGVVITSYRVYVTSYHENFGRYSKNLPVCIMTMTMNLFSNLYKLYI